MSQLTTEDIREYVEAHIGDFHKKRIDKFASLSLNDVLKRKNPYLFKAKNILTSEALVRTILDAFLSSHEETIFGDFLEELAIFVCSKIYNGYKSSAEGIDLEFEKDKVHFLVAIKSGPNWGNSSQIANMKANFKKAKRIRGTNTSKKNIVAVNGCCYGRERRIDKGEYIKYCGQNFWDFISGDEDFYLKIIEPLGFKAKEKNDEFLASYSQLVNRFTTEFSNEFCNDGMIDWEKLVRLNSSA